MKTTSEKFTIKGSSILANYIRQNLNEIVQKKIDLLNSERGFLYLHEDGDLREGTTDQYGYRDIVSFGGKSANEYSAIAGLQNQIDLYSDDSLHEELETYL